MDSSTEPEELTLAILEAELDRERKANQVLIDNLRCAQDELSETNMELIETQRREALLAQVILMREHAELGEECWCRGPSRHYHIKVSP